MALARRYTLSGPPPSDTLNLIPGRWAPVTEGIQTQPYPQTTPKARRAQVMNRLARLAVW